MYRLIHWHLSLQLAQRQESHVHSPNPKPQLLLPLHLLLARLRTLRTDELQHFYLLQVLNVVHVQVKLQLHSSHHHLLHNPFNHQPIPLYVHFHNPLCMTLLMLVPVIHLTLTLNKRGQWKLHYRL